MENLKINNKNKILKFPDNFLWGTSTSAYQIEGGITNDWSEWEKKRVKSKKFKSRKLDEKDFICEHACDSYNRYEEDFCLSKNLNTNAIRFGIEWSRIESVEGKWNMNEIEHYKKMLISAKNKNLKVVLTLWHWTNPVWLSEKGGWTNKKVIDYFERYTKLIVKELGDYVDYWVTLNEPLMHIGHGYLDGKFPPNKKISIIKTIKVFRNLVNSHKKSYKIIHDQYSKASVGVAMTTGYFSPANKWNLIEVLISKICHYFRNDWYLNKIKNYFDYIGVNYYHHDRIVWYPPFKKNKNKKITDMGWEIYPKGIYYVLKKYKKFNKPLIILENGLADAKDRYRVDFIKNHLKYIYKAIQEGVDVRGYFYWSLLDNFEWAEGYAPKFGLYSVDRKTFKRTARPSAKIYAEICKNNLIRIKL